MKWSPSSPTEVLQGGQHDPVDDQEQHVRPPATFEQDDDSDQANGGNDRGYCSRASAR